MVELCGTYPGYGFCQNKGYPTPEHKRLLQPSRAVACPSAELTRPWPSWHSGGDAPGAASAISVNGWPPATSRRPGCASSARNVRTRGRRDRRRRRGRRRPGLRRGAHTPRRSGLAAESLVPSKLRRMWQCAMEYCDSQPHRPGAGADRRRHRRSGRVGARDRDRCTSAPSRSPTDRDRPPPPIDNRQSTLDN